MYNTLTITVTVTYTDTLTEGEVIERDITCTIRILSGVAVICVVTLDGGK